MLCWKSNHDLLTAAPNCNLFSPRTERWICNYNDPLVKAMSEHEATMDQLATTQELRVKSANEVLARMRLIAGMISAPTALPKKIKPRFRGLNLLLQTRLQLAATPF
jgi:hypothetical protein